MKIGPTLSNTFDLLAFHGSEAGTIRSSLDDCSVGDCRKMRVRLKDIARDLNLSSVTISKALRDFDDISEETKKRVRKRIKELGYQPDLRARALATGRTSMIGLVVPDLVHGFFAEIAQAIARTVGKEKYSIVISASGDDPDLEKEEIRNMLAMGLDALIIASVQRTVEIFRRIEEQSVAYVLIDRRFAGLESNFVGVDDEEVGYMATMHLLDQGCRLVAHIGGPSISTSAGRLEGYKKALAQRGITPLRGFILERSVRDSDSERTGYLGMKKLLNLPARPDGVFCHSDAAAIGAMRAIEERGLRIPKDIAVIGCGNVAYGDLLAVPLSTVDQGIASIGQKAAKMALNAVQTRNGVRPKSVLVKPRLIARKSTLLGPF
jgi:LacI family transcriptional regulator